MNKNSFFFCAALLASCISLSATLDPVISVRPFGTLKDGRQTHLYTLENDSGFSVGITDYGGAIVSIYAPDEAGEMVDVVLGFDNVKQYEEESPFFGALIGRYGNRIGEGRFTLDGVEYQLPTNNEPAGMPCTLHGGAKGFFDVLWTGRPFIQDGNSCLELSYLSVEGEEGFPGNLEVTVVYTVTPANELRIDYHAVTDKATPVSLTSHAYFNLSGEGDPTITDELLTIYASNITPVSAGLIPTGEITPVEGTPFDFTQPRLVGEAIDADNDQITYGGGYDHNWVLDGEIGSLRLAAELYDPESGRVMDVLTTEPGLQFYSGNFLTGELVGKSCKPYPKRSALCLESQHFPDSPNHDNFPSTILRPGEELTSTTIYRFTVR